MRLLNGNLLVVTNAGLGETPVPADAIVQPGGTIEAFRDEPGYPMIKLKVLAVVPVGTPVEYAMADQAKPRQARPLMLADRKPHTETLYVLRQHRKAIDAIEIFRHSELVAARQKADKKRDAGELPPLKENGG